MNRDEALIEAGKLISGDRKQAYGDAGESFRRIASMWSAYLGKRLATDISSVDVANMMVLLKVSRASHKPKDDDFVDIIGYAALACENHAES